MLIFDLWPRRPSCSSLDNDDEDDDDEDDDHDDANDDGGGGGDDKILMRSTPGWLLWLKFIPERRLRGGDWTGQCPPNQRKGIRIKANNDKMLCKVVLVYCLKLSHLWAIIFEELVRNLIKSTCSWSPLIKYWLMIDDGESIITLPHHPPLQIRAKVHHFSSFIGIDIWKPPKNAF